MRTSLCVHSVCVCDFQVILPKVVSFEMHKNLSFFEREGSLAVDICLLYNTMLDTTKQDKTEILDQNELDGISCINLDMYTTVINQYSRKAFT